MRAAVRVLAALVAVLAMVPSTAGSAARNPAYVRRPGAAEGGPADAHLPAGPIPANCTRACLEDLVNQYLAAVVAHDPKRLPLSADVKYTEDDQVLNVGDGFWNTATGIGNYAHYFADPVTAQAGWMGTMKEQRGTLLMALRLRVQLGRITEIETSYFRMGGGGPNDIAAMDARHSPEP